MEKIKLHLGCGEKYLPGFIHIDYSNLSHLDYCGSMDNLHMFENDHYITESSIFTIISCPVIFDVVDILHFDRFDRSKFSVLL